MDPLHVESVELGEQLWQKWVEKGKAQDRVRKRRWRIIGSVAAVLLLLSVGAYRWIFAI
jgi:hypothetical protein